MPVIVNGILRSANTVLLAHRTPHRRTYPGTWSFPGGHVEPGETLDGALIRELTEEIGVTAKIWSPLATFTDPAPGHQGDVTFHVFVVDTWQGSPHMIGDEHSELRWLTLDEAVAMPDLTFPIYRDFFKSLATLAPPA